MPLSEKSLEPFLSTLPVVLYEFLRHPDGTGEILYLSPNTKELLGYPPEYFIQDKECKWEFIHPEDREQFKAADRSEFFSIATRILLPSGEVRWVRFRSKPEAKRENGDVVWAGCIVDITTLQEAREEIKRLQGIIPICVHCKGIRDDKGYWNQLERYITERTSATFSHAICDKCMEEHYPEIFKKMKGR